VSRRTTSQHPHFGVGVGLDGVEKENEYLRLLIESQSELIQSVINQRRAKGNDQR